MAVESSSRGLIDSSPAPVPEGDRTFSPLDVDSASSAARFRNLIACVDGSPLSEEILPVAAAWASSAGMTLRLLHVTSPFMTGAGGRWELGLPGEGNPERYLRRLSKQLNDPDLDLRYRVIHSPYIARAIVEYAEKVPGTVVALTTHGWTGLRRLAMGSVAMKVVQECTSPVLVLRPRRPPLHGKWDEPAEVGSLRAAS